MKRAYFITALACLLFVSVHAQISTKESPVSFNPTTYNVLARTTPEVRTLSSINLSQILQEDIEDEKNGVPPRFGYPIKVGFDLNNSGTWTTMPNGDRIWQLSIHSPEALSLNLLYDKFWLPEGAKFFIISEDRKHNIGAFTSYNNKGTKQDVKGFATGLIYGDKITLEYFEPKDVMEQGVISVSHIVHGYRYINIGEESFGNSGACQVNVNCSEGNNWQQEKNAVALILVNGNRYCTGSLINTTANDTRPLFLTADHCLGGWANSVKHDAITNSNLSHWSFYWNYESPTCANPSSEPPILSTVGATVVANNSNTDFALLNLTENPKDDCNITPYYLGWDRTGSAGTGGVGIHHPGGDIKKIATYNITPSNSNCYSSGGSNFWKVNWTATSNGHSVTEGGSSGSPLINSNHRVIGQLYGAATCSNTNCSDPSSDISNYGKFSVSWTGDGATDNRRRLDHWLHPGSGTAPTILNGRPSMTITGVSLICDNNIGTFTLNNAPTGATVTWQAYPSIFTSNAGTDTVANLQLANPTGTGASCGISFTITTACGNTVVQHLFNVGIPPTPNIVPSLPNPIIVQPNTTLQFIVADYAPMYWSFEGSPYTYTISPGDWQCNFTPTDVGDYKVKVRANYGCGYSGYDIVDVKSSRPDLTIQSLSAVPSGSSVTLSYNLKNIGLLPAPSPVVKYYRSSNSTYDAGDTYLGTSSFSTLAANGTVSSGNVTLTLSGSGSYILAYADPSNVIPELLETNNVQARILMEMEMMSANSFTVYPVPFENELNVNLITTEGDNKLSREKETTRKIYLVDFKTSAVVYQITTSDNDHIIDTRQVPSGQYVLIVKGNVTESLLVVKK